MKRATERRRPRSARRHVHLGARLLAIGRIRSGLASVDDVARELEVTRHDVLHWIEAHADERTVTFEELRPREAPGMRRLRLRAQRLASLIAETEKSLRDLHQEYLRGAVASNDPLADLPDSSKKVAGNSKDRASRVSDAQPRASTLRKFVDGDSAR
jgi:hypothetical protein